MIYVDDVKLIESNKLNLDTVHQQIVNRFKIKNLDKIHHYLSMKMIYDCQQQKIHLSQKQYIQQLLKQYEMKNCYSASTSMIFDLKITDNLVKDKQFVQKYQALVGSQQFLIIYMRPDIAFATGFLGRYNNTPTQQCWQAALHLLQYLHETIDYEITFDSSKDYRLVAYSDADWVTDIKD